MMTDKRLGMILASIVVCFGFGVVVLLSHTPDGGAAALRSVGLLIAGLPATIGTVALLIRQSRVGEKIDTTQANTEKMLNGVMDQKLERAVHKVMNEREDNETVTKP